MTQIVEHTLPALKRLKSAGKVRYVGVNGYNVGVLKQIVRMVPPGSIDTVLSYCRFTIFNTGGSTGAMCSGAPGSSVG